MADVLLFHYREAKTGKPLIKALQDDGHRVVDAAPDYPDYEPSIEVADPDVIVADCSHMFNKSIEAADYVTSRKAYRDVPVLLVNLDDANTGFAERKLPGARIVGPDDIVTSVQAALADG